MVEFRLYYDDNGSVICYTSEASVNIDAKYIIIDAETYACTRYDVRVIDNKIVKFSNVSFINKLVPGSGTKCHKDDIMIISDTNTIEWKTKTYEHRHC